MRQSKEQNPAASHEGDVSWQERFEASRLGHAIISVFVAITLASVALWNLPDSELRSIALPVLRPYMNVTGLGQSWALFAPDPPKRSREIIARIEYADGSSSSWRPPLEGVVLAPYRNYRWGKWAENVYFENNRGLWQPTAAWVAEHYDHRGRTPIRVELVRRWRELEPPGSDEPDPGDDWEEFSYYTYELPSRAAS